MRKLLLLYPLLVLLAGCKTTHPQKDFTPQEIEDMATAVEKIRTQRGATNALVLPPLPPEVKMKKSIHAQSIPGPTHYIVARWDADPDPSITYRVEWSELSGGSTNQVDVAQTKIDLVGLFSSYGVPAGWYRISVSSVNDIFVESEQVAATILLWKP